MSLFDNQPHLSQNPHFVGAPSHYAPFKAPRPVDFGVSFASMDAPQPNNGGSSSQEVEVLSDQQAIDVDSDTENVRTERRIMWTPEEDEKLMSAWLKNSTDSSVGADRNNEHYWGDVVNSYNKTIPSQRKRNSKQAKDRWQRYGDKGVPTMILEAVASHNLRIWHAFFFGTAGSQKNDINVLNKSPLFINVLKGKAPRVKYTVNGTQYDMGYYLADKIYPEWAVFVKTILVPQMDEDKLFALMQEGARKDVECAFGVLQSRFDIVRRPARLWKQGDVINIMQACVILHNMIVEDEKDLVKVPLDLNENASATIVLPPEVRTSDSPNPCFAEVLRINFAIQARPTHRQLRNDLVEHIRQRYGNKEN